MTIMPMHGMLRHPMADDVNDVLKTFTPSYSTGKLSSQRCIGCQHRDLCWDLPLLLLSGKLATRSG
jgi:hypothetical protein